MQYRKFWLDLGKLLNSGKTLSQSMNIISILSDGDSFNRKIRQLSNEMQGGMTFTKAIKESGLFSEFEISVVYAGELSNMLEVSVNRLAGNMLPTRASQYENFYRTLAVLLRSGIPTLTSLAMCGKKLDDPLNSAIEHICEVVKEGGAISDGMRSSDEFSDFDVELIENGETSGNLENALLRLAQFCSPIDES